MTRLEEIAESFDGVEKCYAVQAGREIRIMVKPDKVDDDASVILAHDVAKQYRRGYGIPWPDQSGHRSRDPGLDYAK